MRYVMRILLLLLLLLYHKQIRNIIEDKADHYIYIYIYIYYCGLQKKDIIKINYYNYIFI